MLCYIKISFKALVLIPMLRELFIKVRINKINHNKTIYPVQIEISIPNKLFKIIVDNKEYIYESDDGKIIDLFKEFTSDLKVGFFNEIGPVKLHNIKLI